MSWSYSVGIVAVFLPNEGRVHKPRDGSSGPFILLIRGQKVCQTGRRRFCGGGAAMWPMIRYDAIGGCLRHIFRHDMFKEVHRVVLPVADWSYPRALAAR